MRLHCGVRVMLGPGRHSKMQDAQEVNHQNK